MTNITRTNVIIVGAGAITQQWHLPILLGRDDINVVGVIDKSILTCEVIKKAYPNIKVFQDFECIDNNTYACAIVATPAAFHFDITKQLLQDGKHVLVEKPIALNHNQAKELVELAEDNELILSVSLYRRLYPSLNLLKELVQNETWGEVESFNFNWGDFYSWSASTLGNMKKELAGGGVLMDLGPHALDWLSFIFPDGMKLESYKDDALTGIETDCELNLSCTHKESEIKGKVLLSRIRSLGGDLTIHCTQADLNLSVGERFSVQIIPKADDSKQSSTVVLNYSCKNSKVANTEEWFETFGKEHVDFFDAINSGQQAALSGRSALAAAKIIDECYLSKDKHQHEWSNTNWLPIPDLSAIKSVFITGASGFVGGRLVEILAENTNLTIYAGVNNPNNATRISRYNVNMVQFDLNNPHQLTSILANCDAVVHCAVGTTYGDNDLIYKTTVGGTQNLLDACKQNNIKKIVHLSSLAVVEMNNNGQVISETTCQPAIPNDIYSKSKLDAEKLALAFAKEQGLDLTILRPTTIYGPYAPLFKVGAGKQAINSGVLLQEASANSPSNSVYIDNVISAILHVLSSKPEQENNVFFINDDDPTSYKDFYGYFASSFSRPLKIDTQIRFNVAPVSTNSFKVIAGEMKRVFMSNEMRKLALKFYNSEKVGLPIRWLVVKLPKLEDKLRDSSGPVFIKTTVSSSQLPQVDASTSSLVSMSLFKDCYPAYSALQRAKTFELTADWLRFSEHIGK
jgi:predicted dehydrogenase/nucleoside-diphosphate-sugar epimerase